MKRLLPLILAMMLVGSYRSASAQTDWSKVEIKTIPVTENIYMLQSVGGNVGVMTGADGVLLIDDKFEPIADKIRAAIKEIGGADKVTFLLNTHWHGDHTNGNLAFGNEATIIAHTNVRIRLSVPQDVRGRTLEPLPEHGLPVITFNESLYVHFNGETIRGVHFPHGHTDGDMIVFFPESNVVHMGDHMFQGLFPYIDIDHGGNVQGYMDNVRNVIAQLPEDVKIIAGHGDLASLDDLRTFLHMMEETTTLIRKQMADGKSLEDLKAEGLPEKWAEWDWSFITTERWIETVYRGYSE